MLNHLKNSEMMDVEFAYPKHSKFTMNGKSNIFNMCCQEGNIMHVPLRILNMALVLDTLRIQIR